MLKTKQGACDHPGDNGCTSSRSKWSIVLVSYCCCVAQNNTNLPLLILEDHRSGLKSRCQQDCVPAGGSREKPISLSLPAFRGHLHSLAFGPFLHLQKQWHSLFQSLWLCPSLSWSFIYKDPCDYIGPYGQSSIISQAQNPSLYLQSLFCHVGCHMYRFRELGCRPLWGALFCLSQVC